MDHTRVLKLRTSPSHAPWVRVGDKGWRSRSDMGRYSALAPPGRYTVRLKLGDTELEQTLEVARAIIEETGNDSVRTEIADLGSMAEIRALASRLDGPIHLLVNNAGVTRPQPIDEITERDWDEVLAVNLKSMFLVTQAVLPKMRAEEPPRTPLGRS